MSLKSFFEVQFFVNVIPVIAHFVPKHRGHCGASRVIVGNMLLLAAAKNKKENNLNNKKVLSATSFTEIIAVIIMVFICIYHEQRVANTLQHG